MTRGGLLVRCAVVSAMALAGCLIDTSGLSGGPSSMADAGGGPADAGAATDGASVPPGDAASDVCVPMLSGDAGAIAPLSGWDVLGSATADNGGVDLTTNANDQAGAIWNQTPAQFTSFDLTAGFEIVTSGNPGDGFAFAWVAASKTPVLGDTGGALAIDGLQGYAVLIDEFDSPNYPVPPPLIALVDLTKGADTWTIEAHTLVSQVENGDEHFLHVTLDQGHVTARVDSELSLDHVAIPVYTPYSGRWGFGSGTGAVNAIHRITRVSFVDPSRSCQ